MENNADTEKQCMDYLRKKCKSDESKIGQVSDKILLRFAAANSFDKKRAWKRIQKTRGLYILSTKTTSSLIKQLKTKTLFPVPGLRSIHGNNMFYMRPSRFEPEEMDTDAVIANLVYCINLMSLDTRTVRSGIGFIANMKGWTMRHFTVEYCRKFMQVLQGNVVPVNITSFLIVNPPQWFGKIWTFMKTVLSKEFQAKVVMIDEAELPLYLEEGFEKYLPDEFCCGKAQTDTIVKDFLKKSDKKAGTAERMLPKAWRIQLRGGYQVH